MHRFMQVIVWLSVGLTMGRFGSAALGAKFNKTVDIGQQAPDWSDIEATDGKRYGLGSFRDAQCVVLVFTCNHCPVAKAYEARLLRLAEQYRSKGVQFVAVSVSLLEADSLPEMKKRAQEKKYSFPYLHDPSQQLGKRYGAAVTPHVFVLDRDRKISYMGKIDDELHEERATEHFLRDAIDAALSTREPEVSETKPIGCPIEYESP